MKAVRESDEEDAVPGSNCDVELTGAAKALLYQMKMLQTDWMGTQGCTK